MPAIGYFEVRQTRVVKVSASSMQDALYVAEQAFNSPEGKASVDFAHGTETPRLGYSMGDIVVIDTDISKENY